LFRKKKIAKKMKPKTKMNLCLWATIILTLFGIYDFLFIASDIVKTWVDVINITLLSIYILGIIIRNLIMVRIIFRIYFIFFVISIILGVIGALIPMLSTQGRWKEIPIVFFG
jgi:hypothetical protein